MYKGVIIEESLVDKSVLEGLRIIETEVEQVTEGFRTPWLKQWALRTIEIPDDQIDDIAHKIAAAIDPDHTSSWFADFMNDERHYVIFRDKVFVINRAQTAEYAAAVEYGKSIGIPEHQLQGFVPKE